MAEKDILGRQKMTWVIDGRFSLKTNQEPGEIGEMVVTEDLLLRLSLLEMLMITIFQLIRVKDIRSLF